MKNQFLQINYQIDILSFIGMQQKEERSWQSITRKVYKKQEYIYHIGQEPNEIYIIKKGRVKIGKTATSSKSIIKNVITEGDLFGEVSLIGETNRVDYAIAMEETELYILSLEEFYRQMQNQNGLGSYMINLLGSRIMAVEQKIESFILKSSRTRIIDFLSNLAEKKGQRIGFEIIVRKFFTHKEIASITATSRQNVTAILNELRNKNILTFNRRRLLVRNLDLLKAETD